MRAALSRSLGWAVALAWLTTAAEAAPVDRDPARAQALGARLELRGAGTPMPPVDVAWDRPSPRLLGARRALAAEWAGLHTFDRAPGRPPSRIVGRGLSVPGAVASPQIAETFARAFLARHRALFAPGVAADELDVVSDDLDPMLRRDGLAPTPMRTVGIAQSLVTARGARLPVRGGQVSFRFARDQLVMVGSEAVPIVSRDVELPAVVIGDADVRAAAEAWAAGIFGAARAEADVSAPFVLPVNDAAGSLLVVRSVVVDAGGRVTGTGEPERREVMVDAASGEVVASVSLLAFGSADVVFFVPSRAPTFGPRIAVPARRTTIYVNGLGATTSADGGFSFDGPVASVLALPTGLDAHVHDADGNDTFAGFSIADGQTYFWDASQREPTDAALSAYVNASKVRDYARSFAPSLALLDAPVDVEVNVDASCNAYSDGKTIHFYHRTAECENTARMADVVYHEYGHSIHYASVIEGVGIADGSLSEGIADYLAVTITGDAGFGRGFHFDDKPMRNVDPSTKENRWPDDLVGEVHNDGKVAAQALWDLRKLLVAKLGHDAGVAHTDELFYEGIRRAVDIPSFFLEVLAADDDDGDLTNGTPNQCEIDRAFALHGLRPYAISADVPGVVSADDASYSVGLALSGIPPTCPGETPRSVTLRYRRRGAPDSEIDAPMTGSNGRYGASIPAAPKGSVLEVSMEIDFAGADALHFPANPADPWYEVAVGEAVPLYCTDFERDPWAEGWTHGLASGDPQKAPDEWEWGTPRGTPTNGDPPAAYSGSNVVGIDLGDLDGHDGRYAPEATTFLASPVVSTKGHRDVHLRFRRWLQVEDAHWDQASILANDVALWQNLDSDLGDASTTEHRDFEWRFVDLDLSRAVKDDAVAVRFELAADDTVELGGWNVDDVCVVGLDPVPATSCEGDACSDVSIAGHGACALSPLDDAPRSGVAAFALGSAIVLSRRRARRGSR